MLMDIVPFLLLDNKEKLAIVMTMKLQIAYGSNMNEKEKDDKKKTHLLL